MRSLLIHRDHLLWSRYALAFWAILIALACFQSENMVSVTYDLPENAFTEWLVARAENWHGWMKVIGVADVVSTLSEMSAALHDLPVTDEEFE